MYSTLNDGATSYFETGLMALLSMRLYRLFPHAEEPRRGVSKYEVARKPIRFIWS